MLLPLFLQDYFSLLVVFFYSCFSYPFLLFRDFVCKAINMNKTCLFANVLWLVRIPLISLKQEKFI